MQPASRPAVTRATTASLTLILCALPFAMARAQQLPSAPKAAPAAAPARDIPRPDELEPGINTSAPPAPAAPAAPSAPVAPERPSATSAAPTGGATGVKAAPASAEAGAARTPVRKGADRLQLDATEITGNRELPKVLYIVPWKHPDLGDLGGKPVNSLVDEVLQPLDRDVFQRENRYYDALSPGANAPKPGTVPGSANKP